MHSGSVKLQSSVADRITVV